jgi:phosphoserine phosphatase
MGLTAARKQLRKEQALNRLLQKELQGYKAELEFERSKRRRVQTLASRAVDIMTDISSKV